MAQFETKELSFASGGKQIYGVATLPEREGKLPTIIYSHGFGANHTFEGKIQETLVEHGFAVYAIDFAGGSRPETENKSEGSAKGMSVFTEQQNLEDAIAFISQQDFVDRSNLFLLGASQGGVVSTLAASSNPKLIKALLLVFPAFVLFDDARKRYDSVADIPDTADLMGMIVGRKYNEDAYKHDIFTDMPNYHGPVKIFHGINDNLVPIAYSERAVKTFPNASLLEIPNEGHGFTDETEVRVANDIAAFIKDLG